MVSQSSEDHTTPTVHKLNYITLVTAIPKKNNHLNSQRKKESIINPHLLIKIQLCDIVGVQK
jgi:hypothetical protein